MQDTFHEDRLHGTAAFRFGMVSMAPHACWSVCCQSPPCAGQRRDGSRRAPHPSAGPPASSYTVCGTPLADRLRCSRLLHAIVEDPFARLQHVFSL